jgi:hypothetical protein
MVAVVNSTFGSALPSSAISYISKEFDITSSTAQILPLSMYVLGYVLGLAVRTVVRNLWEEDYYGFDIHTLHGVYARMCSTH